MQILSLCLTSLLFLSLTSRSCRKPEPDPDATAIEATGSVYFPAAGCDGGIAVPNFMTPKTGGSSASCSGSENSDTVPDRAVAKVDENVTVELGTVVVMSRSHQQLVLAADSRAAHWINGRYDHIEDKACKVSELRPNLLFAVTDMAKNDPRLPANIYYDAMDLAKEAAAHFKFDSDRMEPNTTTKEIAERWAWDVAFRIRRAVNRGIYRPVRTGMWVRGIFAGLEPNGEISTAVAELEYQPPPPGMTAPVVSISITEERPLKEYTLITAYGRSAVAERYVSKKGTAETRAEHVRIRTAQLGDPKNFPPTVVERLVRLTENEDDVQLPDGSKLVGGDVDFARLRRGGTVEWLRRKEICSPTTPASQ